MPTQRTRHETPGAEPVQAEPDVDSEPRIAALEARVERLESVIEGLQDAVYRTSALEDKEIAELGRRTAPREMARALSEDARRHGV